MATANADIQPTAYSSTVRKTLNTSPYILNVDDAGTYTYIGLALPGALNGEAKWQIKRIVNATGVTRFAEGEISFNKVWDNRASYIYS